MRFSDYEVEYLCLLDVGCKNSHSIRCENMNEERFTAMLTREKQRRLERMTAEIGKVKP